MCYCNTCRLSLRCTVLFFCLHLGLLIGAPARFGTTVLPAIDKQDMRFVTLSAAGGPLNSDIRGVAQDNQGFVWIATDDGLFQYDGYTLRPYLHDPANRNSISSDNLLSLFKDRSGILWIGTAFDGLDRLDSVRGVFTHYRHRPGVVTSLINDTPTCIYQDRGGTLWFGTNGGLERYDPSRGTFFHYTHNPSDPQSLTGNLITIVYEDSHGNFWVGTTQGLNKFDRATGRFERFVHDPKNPSSLGHDYVSSVLEDRSGMLWVSSPFGEGLSSFDPRTQEFSRYSFHQEPPGDEVLSGIGSIHEGMDGILWLGTERDGLLKLDAERKHFTRYVNNPADPFSPCGNNVDKLFEDAEGIFWLGGHTCLSRFMSKLSGFVSYRREPNQFQDLRDNEIWSVRGDSRGLLWVGARTGLESLDLKTGKFTLYRHEARDSHSISDGPVSAIREDRSGKFWVATWGGGLNRFDPATGRFLTYRHDPGNPQSLSGNIINCLLLDREGSLWIGVHGYGIDRLDPGERQFKHYQPEAGDPNSLSGNNVRALFEDHAGNIWVGTIGGGLDRFDRATEKFTVYRHDPRDPSTLSSDAVDAVYEDRRGALWIGTRVGLNRLEPSGAFTKFTIKDGLPDSYVEAIVEGRNGDLWLGTHNGLSRFSPQSRRFQNFSTSDGLAATRLDPYGMEGSTELSDGEMVFGSTDGVSGFYPDRLSPNLYVPPVVVTDFLLFNKPVGTDKNSPIRQPIWATSALTLNHDQSIFTLEFAALSYEAPERNRYRYRLEGLETDWNEVDSSRRSATYTNLAAGHYTFLVQGSNNDLRWNNTGVHLAITVLPPWWATWWSRSVAFVIIAGAVLAAYWWRVRSLHLAAHRLELQVAERTHELQLARDAADAANRAKSRFLAHVSHELRTPLNAILGFSSLLRDREDSQERRKDLDIINRSGEHLLNLIDNVLDLAKIESGRTELNVEPCDLERLVTEITDMIRVRADEKDLVLRVVRSPDFPSAVAVDAGKLRQVLINLLGNAVKFTEKGVVMLSLTTSALNDAGKLWLIFDVEDTGIGIAPEDQLTIFDAFVQASKQKAHKGTGLGLAITRRFVELMDGSIEVASTPGVGTRFRVQLPVDLANESELRRADVWNARVVGVETNGADYKVLVVEDEEENRLVLARLMDNAGFQVRIANNGAEGLEMFQSWRPHFIWMDLRMPVMDGKEAVRRIRALESGCDVKIVAVTASAFTSEREEILAAGVDEFVRKPYRASQLFDCMARLLGLPRVYGEQQREQRVLQLGKEDLSALPDELIRDLRAAVLTLDDDGVTEMIARVSECDAAAGDKLAKFANRHAYTAILKAIEATEKSQEGAA